MAGLFLSDHILYAQGPLVLNRLVEEAKRNNPEIVAAIKRWVAAQARIPQAKSLDDPVIGFTFEKTPGSPFRLNKTMPEDRMLSVTQMFPWFGKLSLKGKIALMESQMFAAEYKNKELDVINEVKNAYYDLFMNYKEIELKEQGLGILEDIARIAEAKYITDDIPQSEVFKINAEIADLSNDILNLRQEASAKKTLLNTLLNRGPEGPLGIPQLKEEASFNEEINSLYKLTLENQPELLIFAYAIEKNRYAKSLVQKSFFPDLMGGIVMRGITSGSIGPWDLMLAFSVPLWFWTKQRYQVKEAIANVEEAEAAYEAMKNKALAQTKEMYSKVVIAKNKINLYQSNLIPILENSIASSLAAFRAGKGDFMMLLDNERMLIGQKMDYYRSLVEYNMNLADLERTLGVDLSEVRK